MKENSKADIGLEKLLDMLVQGRALAGLSAKPHELADMVRTIDCQSERMLPLEDYFTSLGVSRYAYEDKFDVPVLLPKGLLKIARREHAEEDQEERERYQQIMDLPDIFALSKAYAKHRHKKYQTGERKYEIAKELAETFSNWSLMFEQAKEFWEDIKKGEIDTSKMKKPRHYAKAFTKYVKKNLEQERKPLFLRKTYNR